MRGNVTPEDLERLKKRRRAARKKRKKKPVNEKNVFRIIMLVLLISAIEPMFSSLKSTIHSIAKKTKKQVTSPVRNSKRFLMIQVGQGEKTSLVDAILIFNHPEKGTVGMIFPASSCVRDEKGKIIPLMEVNEKNPPPGGWLDIMQPKDGFFIRGNWDQVRIMVDMLKGIRLSLPAPMKYENKKENIFKHVPAGNVLLDSEKIHEYLTFPGNPEEKIKRIVKVIHALAAALYRETPSTRGIITHKLIRDISGERKKEGLLEWLGILFKNSPDRLYVITAPGKRMKGEGNYLLSRMDIRKWLGEEKKPAEDIFQAGKSQIRIGISNPVVLLIRNTSHRPGLEQYMMEFFHPIENLEVRISAPQIGEYHEKTFLYTGEENMETASELLDMLGTGEIKKRMHTRGGYDMLLEIGDDFGSWQSDQENNKTNSVRITP